MVGNVLVVGDELVEGNELLLGDELLLGAPVVAGGVSLGRGEGAEVGLDVAPFVDFFLLGLGAVVLTAGFFVGLSPPFKNKFCACTLRSVVNMPRVPAVAPTTC